MTYVIADVHGRADRFHSILRQIRFSDTDVLYILGDVIDRNPDGIPILLEVMAAGNMQMILGNHEYMMLNVVNAPEEADLRSNMILWFYNGGEVTLQAFRKLPQEERERIVDYLEGLPLNLTLHAGGQDWLLVHGAPEASYTADDAEYEDARMYAVWKRLDPFGENGFPDRIILCGHTPVIHFRNRLPMEVVRHGNVVCMDCGCAFDEGRLACLCLETGEVTYSEDSPPRKRNRWF